MTSPAMRARYLNDSITTASPARLLVMLYERLVLDLSQGENALKEGDRETADDRLKHAQEIIIELRASLRLDLWDGAADLARIYGFLLGELISANIQGDAGKVASCRGLVEPLLDAWRQAALTSIEPSPAA
jgi:flagellar secretion chaperone FliS